MRVEEDKERFVKEMEPEDENGEIWEAWSFSWHDRRLNDEDAETDII
jgi:hypothetical protein